MPKPTARTNTGEFIPVNEPLISKEAKNNVKSALNSGWISSAGPYLSEFEDKFARFIGVKYAIAVSSGTAALHVALLSLGIGPGDEVIVPAFTMAATWLAVLYVGAKPVFIDCELETYNIDPAQIEKKITKKTKAIIPVHIYGHPADMKAIMAIARRHHLFIIEDAAEAHGAQYRGKRCGSFGHINCFSFYANKIITTGEGGMVVTNDAVLAKRAAKYKDLCHSDKKRFIHDGIGYNYRLTNLQAALGCGQLKNITLYLKKKQKIADQYQKLLGKIPGLTLPQTKPGSRNVYWMYGILVDPVKFGMGRDRLRISLKQLGVDTRDFFYPPTDQPILAPHLSVGERFPNTESISRRGLYLPTGLALTDSQIKRVSGAIRQIYDKVNL